MINKAYKFRLYPTKEQEVFFAKSFGASRFIYNYFLNHKYKQWKETGKSDSCFKMQKYLPYLKKEYNWLKEINAQTLTKAIVNLDSAFVNFFKKRSSFPKFKKKDDKQSFSVPQFFKIDEKGIKIPKLKSKIKCVQHRNIEGDICLMTFSKTKSGKYFVSILTEQENNYLETKDGEIGIDLGLKDFITLSNGDKISNQKFLKKKQIKLKKLQRALSKKQKGSNNRLKCKKKIARLHEKITNSRLDFQHKLSNKLTNEYKTICLESLSVRNMMKNHKLAGSISDAAWFQFISMLKYKGTFKKCNIIQIDRFYPSSKTCSKCNFKVQSMNLNVREWKCPSCGSNHDRDINAAKNILIVGKRLNFISSGTDDNKCGEIK